MHGPNELKMLDMSTVNPARRQIWLDKDILNIYARFELQQAQNALSARRQQADQMS